MSHPQPPVVQPPVVQPPVQPSVPQVAAQPQRPRRSRPWLGFGLAVLMVLVWGIGWGLFTHVRMDAYVSHVVPVGESWTDERTGTGYKVLATEVHKRIERGSSDAHTAPDGAVYLLVKMERDNLVEDSTCGFDLVGPDRMKWTTDSISLPDQYPYCSNTQAVKTYWMAYLVPEALLPDLLGVTVHYMQLVHNPALALPERSN